ncbi:Predicted exporter protein, RND superfamily [Halobacterium jilantaiense]|uniref:Predicted exporter protein, RND superfamily n=1 Tax=Halobacterium jilantaiense TaxID=355548 RepID=A0A1I0MFU2_9EURY|nr:Predicted exporter protein, RND superfamily [Halobacterium jilantaiense]
MVPVKTIERIADFVTDHSRAAIAIMLVLTLAVSAGAPMVDQSSSLDQFQSESDESQKLDYIDEHFETGEENTTTAQVIVQGDDVLSRSSLIETLAYEQALHDNETVGPTLSGDDAITGVANIVGIAAIQMEEGEDVRSLASEIEAERAAIEERRTALNETAEALRGELTVLRQNPSADPQAAFESVAANSSVELDDEDAQTFAGAAEALRAATSEEEAQQAYEAGTVGVLREEFQALEQRGSDLQSLADDLEAERAELQDARNASLAEQRAQLEEMNDSEVEDVVARVLSADAASSGTGPSPFELMPSDSFEPGDTSANATMFIVQQNADAVPGGGQVTDDDVVDAQLAMQDLAEDRDLEYLIFGGGIITDEINNSMADSLLIVGPLAVVFVLLALTVAYRDALDIVLGLFGIAAVLAWAFGFMGWTDIDFNQIFIAVPVLLIGLSIDYAIHIFMRHREERHDDDAPASVRGSMKVALSGVGVALVLVTATTVIGFLSNLTSPVPPIQEFGIVSAVGITAALLVFGVLIPALKVELDDYLEGRGWDRKKRAFGTGGGRFSDALSFGATAAQKAPAVVIVLALLVTAAGAYGGTQVDTSFDQEDFLADEPAEWQQNLPEPFAPSEYTAKENLEYVNDRFVREDLQAQILLEGDGVQRDTALERVQDARDAASNKNVTTELTNGEPGIEGVLSAMRSTAAANDSFAETFEAADTDGNGVPDQNVTGVYDAFFDAAPDQASSYIAQDDDGNAEALRMVVSIQGGSSSDDITEQMRDVAETAEGDGITATATGSAILNKIVQDQLLDTVVESLLITLVAVFAFLMLTYRFTDGSATLGAVTLLPVVLSVAWILGTMYLTDIPFNVLTGMITSLTVGLGVAYSIHLSERYMQELESADSVWDAMQTAVTGTGGALLGSAATTVGGFGVLAFAILPPLQQFGIITGLTIIYAFLASVLVLPSLLVVWTKYLGPDWTADDFADDTDDDSEESGAAVAANGAGATQQAAPAAAADAPTRTLSRDLVQPAGSLTATVRLTGDGRVALSESVRGGTVTAVEADPEPVNAVVTDDGVHVAWRLDDATAATATYDVVVDGDAVDGTAVSFVGEALGDSERDVAGDTEATVVSDIFERVFAQAEVTDDDLAAASEAFREGELSADQYDRVVREWARDRPEGE